MTPRKPRWLFLALCACMYAHGYRLRFRKPFWGRWATVPPLRRAYVPPPEPDPAYAARVAAHELCHVRQAGAGLWSRLWWTLRYFLSPSHRYGAELEASCHEARVVWLLEDRAAARAHLAGDVARLCGGGWPHCVRRDAAEAQREAFARLDELGEEEDDG